MEGAVEPVVGNGVDLIFDVDDGVPGFMVVFVGANLGEVSALLGGGGFGGLDGFAGFEMVEGFVDVAFCCSFTGP